MPDLDEVLEKEMATHCSIPTWEIPWTEELGGLQSMESQRVGQDLKTKQQLQMKSTLRRNYLTRA